MKNSDPSFDNHDELIDFLSSLEKSLPWHQSIYLYALEKFLPFPFTELRKGFAKLSGGEQLLIHVNGFLLVKEEACLVLNRKFTQISHDGLIRQQLCSF